MPPCFAECECSCGDNATTFDKLIAEETNFGITLYDVTHAGIHWYTDKSMDDSGLDGVTFAEQEGVYILWHKNDYCPEHDLFHMKGLYVGKGDAAKRLRHHWKTKNMAEEMIIYFTFFACENRKAKYIEQLLLDTYDLPLNRAENTGTKTLCAHFTQSEVD
ncbi:MAG: hypothetical protein MUE84_05670 [Hyphomonas sp.]|jgi:hypothetical protein|nr:hypothetical protein [Hyphomonas sp.]